MTATTDKPQTPKSHITICTCGHRFDVFQEPVVESHDDGHSLFLQVKCPNCSGRIRHFASRDNPEPTHEWMGIALSLKDYTPGLVKVLAAANKEAERLEYPFVGTDHVLLVMSRHKSIGGNVLKKLGITTEQIEQAIKEEKDREE